MYRELHVHRLYIEAFFLLSGLLKVQRVEVSPGGGEIWSFGPPRRSPRCHVDGNGAYTTRNRLGFVVTKDKKRQIDDLLLTESFLLVT